MIGKLTGTVDSVGEAHVIVDVGGIGYEVYCSARTLHNLPPAGGPVSLLIATHVREDHIHLYGFAEATEKAWFDRLQSVQGVGARMALGILSVLAPDAIADAILRQDRKALSQAAGVGGKLAQRIIHELRDKVAKLEVVAGSAPPAGAAASGEQELVRDAVSALVHLGYREADIVPHISETVHTLGADASLDAVIRESLKSLAPTGAMTR